MTTNLTPGTINIKVRIPRPKPLTQLPADKPANAVLTDDQGRTMLGHYDDATETWTLALPCGQIATGIRRRSIQERMARGWTVCS